MKLLLDTHAFLWGVTSLSGIAGQGLSTNASAAFLNLENELYLSAASYWEICIKGSLGKLHLVTDWQRQFEREIAANGIKWLPIEQIHCQKLFDLPFLHGDPFDRMLIAQALCEGMTLLTTDASIRRYTVPTLW